MGEILTVDLTREKILRQPLSKVLVRKFLGGKGLGTHLLGELYGGQAGKDANPLSPESALVFCVGPATGLVQASSRYGVFFKSPLTGIYCESYSGGHFPKSFKASGNDVMVIIGRSSKPVYLFMDDGEASLRKASHLWGKDTYETEDTIKDELGDKKDVKVACIGQAGENLVKFACIENDYWRSAGRGGAGAVMGSKNLKAIAARGTCDVRSQVADEEELEKCTAEINQKIRESPVVKNFREYGTPSVVAVTNSIGVFPTKYWQDGFFEGAEKINAHAVKEKIFVSGKACFNCGIACGKYCEVKKGKYACKVEGPEYETIYALGGLCMIDDIEAIAKFNDVCDRYGMDTMSAGNAIAFAMYACERNRLKSEVQLRFGDADSVLYALEAIAKKQGVGKLLAEGTRAMSKVLKMEDEAIHVKGLEPAGYDPRGLYGMGLAYGIATRGACHLRTAMYSPELSGAVDRYDSGREKVAMLKELEDRYAVFDCLILCRFARAIYDWPLLLKLTNALTGSGYDEKELRKIGERSIDMARLFSVKEGISRKDDLLPERFFKEPLRSGSSKGKVVEEAKFNSMLQDYYSLRGWDAEGIPPARTEEIVKKTGQE